MSKSEEVVIGIDLGTTYSCVAVWQNDRVEVIANDNGNRTTPSVVAFTDTERLIGDAAKNQAAMNPENTVFDAKRLIGRKFSDPTVQADIKHWPFKVVAGPNDKILIEVKYQGETKRFTPEEISAMVLGKMKEIAETYLGRSVDRAVITVPAYFNEAQRSATKDAATIAGLRCDRLLSEPTSASMCYSLDKKTDKEQNVLVFDLGGGTFDLSVLTLDGGVFEVKAVSGDCRLGGEDIDNIMVTHFAQEFDRKYKKDISKDARAIRRLRTACERAKRVLSSAMQASLEVDSLFEGQDFYTSITRAKFEEICMSIFRRTIDPLDNLLRDSKMSKRDIHEIILVGGTTRIPKIQQMLSEYFGGKELNKSVNPDEAVAYGASVQGAILLGQGGKKLDDMILLDVTPLTLGVQTNGCMMEPIINRNSTIPCSKSKTFSTASDNQSTVSIEIYEGERPMTKDNRLLGKFELSGIPPAPRGIPQIVITLDLDANGILNVTAVEQGTGVKKNITIKQDKDRLSKEEIERMVSESEKYKEEDNRIRERIESKNKLENYIYSMKHSISEETIKSKISSDDLSTLEKKLDEMQLWIDSNQNESKETYNSKQKELESVCMPIMTKLYTASGTAPGGDGASVPSMPTETAIGSGSNGPKIEEVD